MRDATQQSIEKCTYSHQWAQVEDQIRCSKCGALPKAKEIPRAEAIIHLRSVLKPGDTVYTILRHVSRSGMSRNIDLYYMKDSAPVWISAYVGHAIGSPQSRKNWTNAQGLTVGGCGMDMGFSLVYQLSHALFPDGFGCTGKGPSGSGVYCPSNDHSNGDRDYTPHENHITGPDHICAKEPDTCKAHKHWHQSGGYALKHQWL